MIFIIILQRANDLVRNNIHPTSIISGYRVSEPLPPNPKKKKTLAGSLFVSIVNRYTLFGANIVLSSTNVYFVFAFLLTHD